MTETPDITSPKTQRRMWRRVWIGIALFVVLTPVIIWIAIDQLGRAEWRSVQKKMQAKGVATIFAELDLPTSSEFPDADNFFAIPLFLADDPKDEDDESDKPESLDDALELALARDGTSEKVDHGAWTPIAIFNAAEVYRHEFPLSDNIGRGPQLGIATDLEAWAQYLDAAAADFGVTLNPDQLLADPLARVKAYLQTASLTWQQLDAAALRPQASLIPPVGERLTAESMPMADAFNNVVGYNDAQRMAKTLSIRTVVAARAGDFTTLRSCLRIYAHLIEACEQEQTMIGELVGITVFANLEPALFECSWNEAWTGSGDELLFCQEILERFDFRQQFIDTMPVELVYGLETARWFRDHRDVSWDFGWGGEALEASRRVARRLPKGWFDNSMAFHCDLADRHLLEVHRRSRRGEYVPFVDVRTATRDLASEIADLGTIDRINFVMPAESLTSYERILDRIQQAEAGRRMAIIVCALHRWKLQHGHFPETLDQLVPDYLNATVLLDPIDGHQLRYRPAKVGAPSEKPLFLLYSVARDSVDDGGELVIDPDRLERTRIHTDDYRGDWPWPVIPRLLSPSEE